MKRTRLGLQDAQSPTTWTPWGPQPFESRSPVANDRPAPANSVAELSTLPKPFRARRTVSEFLRRHYFAVGPVNRSAALGDFLKRCFGR